MSQVTVNLSEDLRGCLYDHLKFLRFSASDWDNYRLPSRHTELLIRRESARAVIALVRGKIMVESETGVVV